MAKPYGKTGLGLKAAAIASAIVLAACSESAVAQPTVVELFQSQGCSSCPPANENIIALTGRPDLLVLSFGVVYWDRLGWKDTFASRENTQRQRDYANGGLKRDNVATPEVVINGYIDIVGNDRAQLDRAIRSAKLPTAPPAITFDGAKVSVAESKAPVTSADVWLVRYDPRTVQVAIKAGENGGRTLPHRNVVRELVRLGVWTGRATMLAVPAATDSAYRTAILIQGGSGGPILSALKQ